MAVKDDINYNKNLSKINNHKITLSNPKLIKLFYKKNKLSKLKCNYGANFDEESRYFLSLESANSFIENYRCEQEKHIKNVGEKTKKKTKKKKLMNFLYFALNVAVIAVILSIQLSKESNPLESFSVILDIKWEYILLAFGTFLVCMLMDQIRFAVLIHKASGAFRFRLAYKVGALGRHYDVITPLSTGGQPFQIFYLNKYGLKPGESISIAMGKYIFYQIIYFICISFILFSNVANHTLSVVVPSVAESLVSTLSWIGYAICFVVLFFITFITVNRRAGTNFVAGLLKLLNKIKIGKFKVIKNYNLAFNKTMKTVNDWQKTTKAYRKSFWVIFVNVVASLIFFVTWYTMPYFVYCAFPGNSLSVDIWWQIVTIAVMVDLTSAFNPIPMGIGTADLSFTVLYGALFAPTAQVLALIIWRFLVYYIYILQGLGIFTYDYAIGDKRLKKNKEFWMLPYRERLKALRREKRK